MSFLVFIKINKLNTRPSFNLNEEVKRATYRQCTTFTNGRSVIMTGGHNNSSNNNNNNNKNNNNKNNNSNNHNNSNKTKTKNIKQKDPIKERKQIKKISHCFANKQPLKE